MSNFENHTDEKTNSPFIRHISLILIWFEYLYNKAYHFFLPTDKYA